MNSRGQGTIEYLVIIAIVVVISLVVVALLLGIFDTNSGQIGAQTQQLDLTTQPLAVKSSLIGTGQDANGLIVISNNTGNLIQDIDVYIGGKYHSFYNNRLSQGDTKTLKLSELEVVCNPGETKSYQELKITYITREGISQTINYGTVALDCTEETNPTPTKPPTEENYTPIIKVMGFRAMGVDPEDPEARFDERGVIISLKNNLNEDILLESLVVAGAEVPWQKEGERGFEMIESSKGNRRPAFNFCDTGAHPDCFSTIPAPIIKAKETRTILVRNGQHIGWTDTGSINLEPARPKDIFSPQIIINYKYKNESTSFDLGAVSAVIENASPNEIFGSFYYLD